jgi:hypothetical protein
VIMATRPMKRQHQEVFIDAPLYEEFDFSGIDDKEFAKFILGGAGLDAFCVECKQMSVFRLDETPSYLLEEKAKSLPKYGVITLKAECSRHADNYNKKCTGKIYFCLYRDGDKLIKIGQYPTKADLDFGSLEPAFSKELAGILRAELGRAIGLRAHGIGVGSFVYLRRVFESLIEEAHVLAKSSNGWDDSDFQKARMPERIKLLKAYLPNRLVETSKLYDILSLGLHELSEEDCLKHFDLIQKAILMILKERHEEREYKEMVKSVNREASKSKADARDDTV